jgi:hypothetical protein
MNEVVGPRVRGFENRVVWSHKQDTWSVSATLTTIATARVPTECSRTGIARRTLADTVPAIAYVTSLPA